jgi:hypothetical protein
MIDRRESQRLPAYRAGRERRPGAAQNQPEALLKAAVVSIKQDGGGLAKEWKYGRV